MPTMEFEVNSQSKFHSGIYGGSYFEKDFVVEFSVRNLERRTHA